MSLADFEICPQISVTKEMRRVQFFARSSSFPTLVGSTSQLALESQIALTVSPRVLSRYSIPITFMYWSMALVAREFALNMTFTLSAKRKKKKRNQKLALMPGHREGREGESACLNDFGPNKFFQPGNASAATKEDAQNIPCCPFKMA